MATDRHLPRTEISQLAEDENDFEFHSEPGHLVRRLHQIGVSLFLELTRDIDITPIQYACLNAVQTHSGFEQRQISRLIAVDRSTINSVTGRLEERGLLTRRRVGRRIDLFMTEAGSALLKIAAERTADHSSHLLAPLTVAQRQQFMRLLKIVVDGNNNISRVPMKTPEEHRRGG